MNGSREIVELIHFAYNIIALNIIQFNFWSEHLVRCALKILKSMNTKLQAARDNGAVSAI